MFTTTYVPGTSVVDIAAPGGIDALLAFHRATFGDAVMEATGDAPAPQPADPAPAGAPSAPANGEQEQQPTSGETLPDDPEALKAEIARLRRENGAARTNAKATAADEARTALVQELGKALGLVKDGQAAPTADQLTAQVQASQADARTARVELAVHQRAATHQGDPAALLDSRAFLAKIADLDPTGEDFTTQVDNAIKAAVADNPKLKAAPVATSSSVDHAGGTGEGAKKPTSIEGAATAHYAGRSA
jgi:hypothetical protein